MLYEIGMGAGAKGESGASQSIEGDTGGMTQAPKLRGPMDKFASSQARQSTLNSKWKQEERKDVCRKIGRFIYCKALPFNLVNDPYWVAAVDGIANYGPGFKPPSMHELRTWILKAEVEDINVMMEEHKKAWKQYGCSIMSDGWTDGKSRVLINFLVNSHARTWFLKSIDASNTIKNGELMFNYLDSVVDEIGEDNVVQVITDNASNYVNARSRLMEKRKKLYWTPCAAHYGKSRVLINFLVNSPAGTWFLKSIDASDTIKNGELMFNYLDSVVDEIGEDNVVQVITDNASNYVNARSRLMEKRKKLYWTPCAAHCIDLMLEDIGKLKVCDQTLSLSRQVVKFIYGHCWVLSMMRSFTKNSELLRPAVTRFATAYLTFQSLYKQKQPLQAMFSSEKWASSSWARKVEGVKARATVLFDPKFWPNIAFCIKSTIPLVSVLREVDSEERPAMVYIYELMDLAKEKIAFNCGGNVRKYGPIWNKIDARWTPQLHRPLHAAGYYLNPQLRYRDSFSNVEEIHTKKRNRLEHKHLNALVYVKYNTKVRERSIRRRQNIDPILIDEIDSDDEWIAEKEDPVLSLDASWLDEEELFDAEAIRTVPITTYDRSVENRSTMTTINVDSSSNAKKRKVGEGNDRGKGKAARCTLADEDMELEEVGGIDDGTYPIIDIADEDDDNINEDDLE
ncbi:uncharacterized protein LOC114289897 [Camellia sinensis]|uniref:uncharacterized protein LOC114289897 n=1 Tax=Camellia sinensis TaxID=4442 RepID=UPI0010356326|nr:uncharacterized protein LOC114289897 [Camellia sinensis]